MKTSTVRTPRTGGRPLVSRLGGRMRGGRVIALLSTRKSGPEITHRLPGTMERMNGHSGRSIAMIIAMVVLGTAVTAQLAHDPNRIRTVVLDAGHGGKDPGNLGTGRYKTTEKHVALNVARLVGKYINEAFPDVKVIYTRDDDRFIELKERCEIANRNKADVFISIHCNANDSHDPHGCETYVMGLHKTEANMRVAQRENESILLEDGHELKYDGYDPKDPESIIALSLRQNVHLDQGLALSAAIQKQFKDRVGRSDRGVKQAGFLVISYTTMPAVLVELGFLTNATEEDYLQGSEGQDLMASAIYRAFKEYKATMEGTDIAPAPPPKTEPAAPDTTR
ncbi:MAG TPA: N-acetylmuramoyl-L-alanine amidase, partial [Flavobacteriales bacterium]|nr:N-acetylmuramoyl-L-alanine amidase [Flavobacteriales bacterium]